jgi:hypothetical protein
MKRTIKMILLLVVLIWVVVFLVGRIKWPIQLDQGWSPQVTISSTQSALDGSLNVCKWHGKIIFLSSQHDWGTHSSTCSLMIRNNDASNSWTQLPVLSVPGAWSAYFPAFDQVGDKIMFEGGYIESNKLQMSATFARTTANNGIQVESERKWMANKSDLFGTDRQNVRLTEWDKPGERTWLLLGAGIINDSELYFPSCMEGFTTDAKEVAIARGPNWNGVFHSKDFGKTWQLEQVSDSDSFNPSVCRTEGNYYYLANGIVGNRTAWALWFSRKSAEGNSWDAPKAVTRTVPIGVDERYSAVAEGDTIHVCWLDNRHEIKYWLSLARSGRGNYEVAYCRRKDSDASWRKAIILSRGVMFAYSPSMSVEGDKIVVAWAGAQTAHAWPFEGDPSDIYYATSKDGGKTWSKPLQVTDHAKDGITSGSARVALQNGVIHLFYAQGKFNRATQVNQQGGWPVYYQQRPFSE